MNASNPFQIPTCYQIELQNRRRDRFKKGIIITVAATVTLLVGLLIEGCVSGHSKTAFAPPAQMIAVAPVTTTVAVAKQKQISIPQPARAASPVVTVPPASVTPAPKAADTVYVVRSGDTIAKIAKARGITVKAIKSANDLSSDSIVVGAKLKIPTA